MHILAWREVYFPGVVLIGLIAGYVMAMAGLWAASMPGLVAFDIANVGRRYMVSDRPSAWLLGLAAHLFNSILLVLVFAMVIVPNIPWPRPALGVLWGMVLAIVLDGSFVAPLSGQGFLGWKAGGWHNTLTIFLLHMLWGFLVGVLYVGP